MTAFFCPLFSLFLCFFTQQWLNVPEVEYVRNCLKGDGFKGTDVPRPMWLFMLLHRHTEKPPAPIRQQHIEEISILPHWGCTDPYLAIQNKLRPSHSKLAFRRVGKVTRNSKDDFETFSSSLANHFLLLSSLPLGGDWRYQRWLYSQGAEPSHSGTVSIAVFLAPLSFPAILLLEDCQAKEGARGKVVSVHDIHMSECTHKPSSAAYLVCCLCGQWSDIYSVCDTHSLSVLKVTVSTIQDRDRAMYYPYNLHIQLWPLQSVLRCLRTILWCHKPKELFYQNICPGQSRSTYTKI